MTQSTKDVLKHINKTYGDNVASEGVELIDERRLPTGVFPFDMATGGGFPEGRVSLVYGPESSLKTTIVLLAIAHNQKFHPERTNVFIDVECSYNPEWGAALGVDNEKLIYSRPDYAEQVVDIAEAFLYAEDIGIVAVDSLGALITANEVDSSAEKAVVGGAGLVVGRLYRKVTLALGRGVKEGRMPTFIAINQIRFKIGVMYGDPETMPGGVAFKFASSLTVRMYGKDELDKKVNAVLPAWKYCSGIIKKWKVPVVARSFEFKLATMPMPMYNLDIGQTDDWNTILAYLKEYGMVYGNGKNWVLHDKEYGTLKEIRALISANPEYGNAVRQELIEKAQEENNPLTKADEEEENE